VDVTRATAMLITAVVVLLILWWIGKRSGG
jgi:hypothetical protein